MSLIIFYKAKEDFSGNSCFFEFISEDEYVLMTLKDLDSRLLSECYSISRSYFSELKARKTVQKVCEINSDGLFCLLFRDLHGTMFKSLTRELKETLFELVPEEFI